MSQCYQPCISPQWQLLSTHKRQKLGPPAYFVEEEEEEEENNKEDLVRITISPGRPAPPRRPQPQAGTRRHQGRGQRPPSCWQAAGGWEGGGCGAPWGDRGGLRHRAAIEWKIRDKSGREGRYPMLSNGSYWQGKISSQAENSQDFIFICQSETNSVVMYLSLLIISECGSITPTQVLTISPISTQCKDLNFNGF